VTKRRKLAEQILDSLSPMPVRPDSPGLSEAVRDRLTNVREERLQKIEALLKKGTMVWEPHIVEAIEQYEKYSAIPLEQFPGHRRLCLANQVGYIGEAVAGAYKAQRDTA
jgi:hypothetical protein